MEKLYLVIACPRCHVVQVVNGRNKSRSCASCNKRFEIRGLAVLGRSTDAREARRLAADVKAKQAPSSNQR